MLQLKLSTCTWLTFHCDNQEPMWQVQPQDSVLTNIRIYICRSIALFNHCDEAFGSRHYLVPNQSEERWLQALCNVFLNSAHIGAQSRTCDTILAYLDCAPVNQCKVGKFHNCWPFLKLWRATTRRRAMGATSPLARFSGAQWGWRPTAFASGRA